MLKEVTEEIYFTDTEVNVTQENHEKDEMEEDVKRKPERKNSVDDFFEQEINLEVWTPPYNKSVNRP